MGKVKEANHSNYYTGIHAYDDGEKTLFINAENGSAIFGKKDYGQVIIDPSSDRALLYSSNFWTGYKENGLPNTTYSYSNNRYSGQSNEGMLIDLTAPRIIFGSGNFRVDPNGTLTAVNGNFSGSITSTSGYIGG
jgi:hypothetical protein